MAQNGSKWLEMGSKKNRKKKHKAADVGGMAPPAPGVNSSKWVQKKKQKKTEPPARGKTGVPSKVKTIWRGQFFFEIDPDPGGPLRVREGGPLRVGEGVLNDREKNRWVF